MTTKKRKASLGLARTENVQVRLNPLLKWQAELAARMHRQPLSAFIEWCVVRALPDVVTPRGDSAIEVGDTTWDIEPGDKLMRLAMGFPELLTYPESQIWRHVKETPAFWDDEPARTILNLGLMRACWPWLEAIPDGALPSQENMKQAILKVQAEPCVTLATKEGTGVRVFHY